MPVSKQPGETGARRPVTTLCFHKVLKGGAAVSRADLEGWKAVKAVTVVCILLLQAKVLI